MPVSVNLRDVHGATQREREVFDRAAANLERAINHRQFAAKVLNAPYEEIFFRPRGSRNRITKTPRDVLRAIQGGVERDTSPDSELDIEIRIDASIRPNVTGSTTPGRLPWRTARWFVNSFAHRRRPDTVTPARHLVHEWLHVAGFVHRRNNGYRKDPPYLVGAIVRELLRDRTLAPDAHEDPEVAAEFEASKCREQKMLATNSIEHP